MGRKVRQQVDMWSSRWSGEASPEVTELHSCQKGLPPHPKASVTHRAGAPRRASVSTLATEAKLNTEANASSITVNTGPLYRQPLQIADF